MDLPKQVESDTEIEKIENESEVVYIHKVWFNRDSFFVDES